jgi:hypothetical protein
LYLCIAGCEPSHRVHAPCPVPLRPGPAIRAMRSGAAVDDIWHKPTHETDGLPRSYHAYDYAFADRTPSHIVSHSLPSAFTPHSHPSSHCARFEALLGYLTACQTKAAKYRSARMPGTLFFRASVCAKGGEPAIPPARSGREEVCTERPQQCAFRPPNQPRVHLPKSLYGPKSERFVNESDRLEAEMRQLETVPRSSATTHTKLVNLKFVNRRILKTLVLASGTPAVGADVKEPVLCWRSAT